MASRHAPATITVNRAPVLTLWAAVEAERLGFDRNEALTMGRAVDDAACRGREGPGCSISMVGTAKAAASWCAPRSRR